MVMARLNYSSGGVPQYRDYTPGADVAAGDVVVVGDTLLICTGGSNASGAGTGIGSGRLGAAVCRGGMFDVVADGAIPAGARVYWNASTQKVTLTRGSNLQFGYNGNRAASADGDSITVEFAPGGGNILPTAVVAAGSAQNDAAALADGVNVVTAADGTKGVLLPTAWPGREVRVKNAAAAVLKVWPATADGINAIAVNSSMSIAANTFPTFVAIDATTWYTQPLLPS